MLPVLDLYSSTLFGTMTDPLARAKAALARLEINPASPFAAADVRACRAVGAPVDIGWLLGEWKKRQPGGIIGRTRYRWDTSHEFCALPSFSPPVKKWRAWHAAEQEALERKPFAFEERISLPVLIAEACELLAEISSGTGPDATVAAELLFETEPVFRYDLAGKVLAAHAWTDTFALFALARIPRASERLWPLILALTTTYADLARRSQGIVHGTRFPFHEKPLVSASAHLAAALLRLSLDVPVLARLIAFVRGEITAEGSWGDAGGPPDVLTTFVAADLLLHIDPSFEPEATLRFFAERQGADGFWRALGPEAAWLTAGIASWIADLSLDFGERFRWPVSPEASRDRKTGLPFFAYFDDLSRLYAELPGIACGEVDLAFIDLAGFRDFNNAHGQQLGDAVLAAFAEELRTLPGTAAIRDGGDEFLVVGAPARKPLAPDLDTFRRAWPRVFRDRFGDAPEVVAPRILVHRTRADALLKARETLGRAIGDVKHAQGKPGPEGILCEWLEGILKPAVVVRAFAV